MKFERLMSWQGHILNQISVSISICHRIGQIISWNVISLVWAFQVLLDWTFLYCLKFAATMSAVGRISHQTDRSRWSANVCECQTNPAFVTYFVFLLFLTFRNVFSHIHSATEKWGKIVKRGESENDFDLDEKWQILGLVSNYLWSAIGFNPSSIHHRTVINPWLICHKCNLRNTHVFFSDNRVSWRCDRLVTIS